MQGPEVPEQPHFHTRRTTRALQRTEVKKELQGLCHNRKVEPVWVRVTSGNGFKEFRDFARSQLTRDAAPLVFSDRLSWWQNGLQNCITSKTLVAAQHQTTTSVSALCHYMRESPLKKHGFSREVAFAEFMHTSRATTTNCMTIESLTLPSTRSVQHVPEKS